jgi:hypothetical protein
MPEAKEGHVNIHGKEYATVAYRVAVFRKANPHYGLITEIIDNTENRVVVKATITEETGRILATGHGEEFRSASQINRTSAMENCETSAIGRALASLGYGGTEFASANEVQNAIHQQKTDPFSPEDKMTFDKLLEGDDVWEFWLFLQFLDNDARIGLFDSFPRGKKTEFKKRAREMETRGAELFAQYLDDIKTYIDNKDDHGLREVWDELGKEGATVAWKELAGDDRLIAKELLGGS